MPRALLTTSAAIALTASAFTSASYADTPKVVTDIAPIHGLVSRVMQGVGEADLIVPAGASPHSYALRPSQARALSKADAVFWVGSELERWLGETVTKLATSAHVIELLDTDGTVRLEFREGATFAAHDHGDHDEHGHDDHDEHGHDDHDEHGHDDHDEHGHDDHDDHGHEGHSHEGIDPHAWLSPVNGKIWLDVIAHELAEIDPEHAETYFANAKAGQAEIDVTVAKISAQLAPVHEARFIVFHDAYQYFEQAFDLNALGAISLGDASDPSAGRIAELRSAVSEFSPVCVFSEPQFNPGLVDTVIQDSGANTVVLDPIGMDVALGAQFYPGLLESLGQSIVDCLSKD